MKKAYIHIGLAKTGTTAIQHGLVQGEEILGGIGLRVLRTGRVNGGHHGIAWRITGNEKADRLCGDYTLADTARELAANRHTDVVVSSEGFSILGFNAAQLNQLQALFDGHATVGIVYVREQVEYFNSYFVELIKGMRVRENINVFAERMATQSRYKYANWMAPFRNKFADFIVRPYDTASLVTGDVVGDFFSVLGLGAEREKLPANKMAQNPSLSPAFVAALQHAIRKLDDLGIHATSIGVAEFEQIRKNIILQLQGIDGLHEGTFWGISPPLALLLRRSFAESNKSFFSGVGLVGFNFRATEITKEVNAIEFADIEAHDRDAINEVVRSVISNSVVGK